MILYGTAALALSTLLGKFVGELLGVIVGVDANVGGVGFGMLFLILIVNWMRNKNLLPEPTEHGVLFWSGMYIPVVVAMASIQNVAGALDGGLMAFLAGFAALVLGLLMVPVISRIGGYSEPLPPVSEQELEEQEV
ncbi:MAG TPA: malonate transporter subunit MadL [Candidatus Yaniella excrementigallinarum]|nr:malonate transporter subunit MadL [Candidatus Yaniella excrementigallinarum]